MEHDDERVTERTRRAEAVEARTPHRADRPSTSEEDDAVEGRAVDPAVRAHHQEMTRTGAHEKGEGRIP